MAITSAMTQEESPKLNMEQSFEDEVRFKNPDLKKIMTSPLS
jgi:hypothetical protein